MLCCSVCGAAVVDPSARRSNAQAYYEDEYTLTQTSRSSAERHRIFRLPEYYRLLNEIGTVQPAPASWLDVGCDHGFFLDEARRAGYTVEGVELASKARAYGLQMGLTIHASLELVHNSFDVISLWHVLEHIPDPRAMIEDLVSRLQPGGTLALRVPDAGSFWSRLLQQHWIWFQPGVHVVHFTKNSIRVLLENAGLDVIAVRSQRPNSRLTRKSYHFANTVLARTVQLSRPSVRDHVARLYQDITGVEIMAIAQKK